MCTQKASRSNPLGLASCDLSFTFPQQRKKKKAKPKQLQRSVVRFCHLQETQSNPPNPGEVKFQTLPHPPNHRLQRGAVRFPWDEPEGTSSCVAAGQMCCSFPLHALPPQPVPSMRNQTEFVLRWRL